MKWGIRQVHGKLIGKYGTKPMNLAIALFQTHVGLSQPSKNGDHTLHGDRCAGDTTSWIYNGYMGIIEKYGKFGE